MPADLNGFHNSNYCVIDDGSQQSAQEERRVLPEDLPENQPKDQLVQGVILRENSHHHLQLGDLASAPRGHHQSSHYRRLG